MKKIRCIIKNYLKENPSCLKAGILTAAAIVCTAGLYAADNSESVKTNEKGEIILKREQGEKETLRYRSRGGYTIRRKSENCLQMQAVSLKN